MNLDPAMRKACSLVFSSLADRYRKAGGVVSHIRPERSGVSDRHWLAIRTGERLPTLSKLFAIALLVRRRPSSIVREIEDAIGWSTLAGPTKERTIDHVDADDHRPEGEPVRTVD